mmetsp:Transcript_5385/g.7395  ORF Transcript_5385/g.7395 Transcript_5385/m.7395 type:complete len:265 (-) Transcript_5385:158-952(-)
MKCCTVPVLATFLLCGIEAFVNPTNLLSKHRVRAFGLSHTVGRTSLLKGGKGPLGRISDLFEEAAASTIDYLLMQPKRDVPDDLRRVRTQFIAALADPNASSGTGAEQWGIWRVDPGPRGVYLSQFDSTLAKNGWKAPAGWMFDSSEFWIEEFGRIMEKPDFPCPPGRYLVTGGRQVTTVLKIDPPDSSGKQRWSLADGAKLYDVTHLPCRSAKYTPVSAGSGSPADANVSDYPVKPGGPMPPIPGCKKQDYAVLFVVAIQKDS